jgi:hypothetical protein
MCIAVDEKSDVAVFQQPPQFRARDHSDIAAVPQFFCKTCRGQVRNYDAATFIQSRQRCESFDLSVVPIEHHPMLSCDLAKRQGTTRQLAGTSTICEKFSSRRRHRTEAGVYGLGAIITQFENRRDAQPLH